MKATIVVLLLSFTLFTCKNEKECCTGPDEIDQVWLNKTIAELEQSSLRKYFYIVKATYEDQCIMYVNNCCPVCDTIIILYRCDGTKLENPDLTKIKNETVAWKPDDFVCQLM